MDCPTCGKALSTERGVRQHHTKVHGDPLSNRECADCGERFYDPKSRRKYCEDCYSESGERNGNYSAAREAAECERCGGAFEYYPSDKEGVYCPSCVAESNDFLGTPYAELLDVDHVTRACECCGEALQLLPSTVRQGYGRFCSNECLYEWMSADKTAVYNGRWREVRRRVLERDDHRCQKCGRTPAEIGREPDVHHIKPVRTFDDPQDSHKCDNLVALCPRCHATAEHGNMEILPPE